MERKEEEERPSRLRWRRRPEDTAERRQKAAAPSRFPCCSKPFYRPPIWLRSGQKVWQPRLVLPEPSRSGYLHPASRHLTTCETRAAWESPHPWSARVFASQWSGDIIRFMFLRGPLNPTNSPLGPSAFTSSIRFPSLLQVPGPPVKHRRSPSVRRTTPSVSGAASRGCVGQLRWGAATHSGSRGAELEVNSICDITHP